MKTEVGNINMGEAAKTAAELGFPVFLGGLYGWDRGYKERWTAGAIRAAEQFRALPKGAAVEELDGKPMPAKWHYDPVRGIVFIQLVEDYSGGQVSTAFFGR